MWRLEHLERLSRSFWRWWDDRLLHRHPLSSIVFSLFIHLTRNDLAQVWQTEKERLGKEASSKCRLMIFWRPLVPHSCCSLGQPILAPRHPVMMLREAVYSGAHWGLQLVRLWPGSLLLLFPSLPPSAVFSFPFAFLVCFYTILVTDSYI